MKKVLVCFSCVGVRIKFLLLLVCVGMAACDAEKEPRTWVAEEQWVVASSKVVVGYYYDREYKQLLSADSAYAVRNINKPEGEWNYLFDEAWGEFPYCSGQEYIVKVEAWHLTGEENRPEDPVRHGRFMRVVSSEAKQSVGLPVDTVRIVTRMECSVVL